MEGVSNNFKLLRIVVFLVVVFSSNLTRGQAPNASAIEIGKYSYSCQMNLNLGYKIYTVTI